MAIRINTNVPAISAQRYLGTANKLLALSMERLSSGKRINRAADDAAGLAIAETLRAQVMGSSQAVANAQDGINLIQTAEGGLEESTNILQRMRELAVQASNDTYTQGDRSKIQEEIGQLRDELTRIGNTTQYNGRNLIDGSIAQSSAQTDASITLKSNARVGDASVTTPVFGDLIASISVTNSTTAATVDVAIQFQLVASPTTAGQVDLSVRTSDGYVTTFNNIGAGSSQTFTTNGGATISLTTGTVAATATNAGAVAVAQLTSITAAVSTDQALSLHIGANEGQIVKAGFADMRASALKLEAATVLGTTDADSRTKSQNLIGLVDDALKTVNTQRARMGAMQNRLEHTISNLQVAHENMSASESRIRDTDVSKESTLLTRQQILTQVATAMLGQANSVQANVLNLIR
jgi:flagellin